MIYIYDVCYIHTIVMKLVYYDLEMEAVSTSPQSVGHAPLRSMFRYKTIIMRLLLFITGRNIS